MYISQMEFNATNTLSKFLDELPKLLKVNAQGDAMHSESRGIINYLKRKAKQSKFLTLNHIIENLILEFKAQNCYPDEFNTFAFFEYTENNYLQIEYASNKLLEKMSETFKATCQSNDAFYISYQSQIANSTLIANKSNSTNTMINQFYDKLFNDKNINEQTKDHIKSARYQIIEPFIKNIESSIDEKNVNFTSYNIPIKYKTYFNIESLQLEINIRRYYYLSNSYNPPKKQQKYTIHKHTIGQNIHILLNYIKSQNIDYENPLFKKTFNVIKRAFNIQYKIGITFINHEDLATIRLNSHFMDLQKILYNNYGKTFYNNYNKYIGGITDYIINKLIESIHCNQSSYYANDDNLFRKLMDFISQNQTIQNNLNQMYEKDMNNENLQCSDIMPKIIEIQHEINETKKAILDMENPDKMQIEIKKRQKLINNIRQEIDEMNQTEKSATEEIEKKQKEIEINKSMITLYLSEQKKYNDTIFKRIAITGMNYHKTFNPTYINLYKNALLEAIQCQIYTLTLLLSKKSLQSIEDGLKQIKHKEITESTCTQEIKIPEFTNNTQELINNLENLEKSLLISKITDDAFEKFYKLSKNIYNKLCSSSFESESNDLEKEYTLKNDQLQDEIRILVAKAYPVGGIRKKNELTKNLEALKITQQRFDENTIKDELIKNLTNLTERQYELIKQLEAPKKKPLIILTIILMCLDKYYEPYYSLIYPSSQIQRDSDELIKLLQALYDQYSDISGKLDDTSKLDNKNTADTSRTLGKTPVSQIPDRPSSKIPNTTIKKPSPGNYESMKPSEILNSKQGNKQTPTTIANQTSSRLHDEPMKPSEIPNTTIKQNANQTSFGVHNELMKLGEILHSKQGNKQTPMTIANQDSSRFPDELTKLIKTLSEKPNDQRPDKTEKTRRLPRRMEGKLESMKELHYMTKGKQNDKITEAYIKTIKNYKFPENTKLSFRKHLDKLEEHLQQQLNQEEHNSTRNEY